MFIDFKRLEDKGWHVTLQGNNGVLIQGDRLIPFFQTLTKELEGIGMTRIQAEVAADNFGGEIEATLIMNDLK